MNRHAAKVGLSLDSEGEYGTNSSGCRPDDDEDAVMIEPAQVACKYFPTIAKRMSYDAVYPGSSWCLPTASIVYVTDEGESCREGRAMERSEPRMLGQEARDWWDKEASVVSPARVAGLFSVRQAAERLLAGKIGLGQSEDPPGTATAEYSDLAPDALNEIVAELRDHACSFQGGVSHVAADIVIAGRHRSQCHLPAEAQHAICELVVGSRHGRKELEFVAGDIVARFQPYTLQLDRRVDGLSPRLIPPQVRTIGAGRF